MLAELWPMETFAPCAARLSVRSEAFWSEPEIWWPWCKYIWARAETPIPPMPMKWTFCMALLYAFVDEIYKHKQFHEADYHWRVDAFELFDFFVDE